MKQAGSEMGTDLKTILFRCDASLSIGSGHVMRCRTLARALQQKGARIWFLCRKQPGDLINLIEQEFKVISLPEQSLKDCKGLEGRELYKAWLGCSREQDASQCVQLLGQNKIESADWLVADHYGLDSTWENQLKSALTKNSISPKLLAIDDIADRRHEADILLDQNFFGSRTQQRYEGLVTNRCRQLLGPHYALLAPEYARLHDLVPTRTQIKRVLIFFGGVDIDNLTAQALNALTCPELNSLAVDVVVGRQSPHRAEIEKLAAKRPFTTLHWQLPSLAGLIARADLAIGAGGTTTWERICLKLPSLVISIASNQLPFAESLDKDGYIKLLGDSRNISVDKIRSTLLKITSKPVSNIDIGNLTDGWGAERVAIAMIGLNKPPSLRPAIPSDRILSLQWSEEKKISATKKSADIDASINPRQIQLIATSPNGCPIGQISIEQKQLNAKSGIGIASIDMALDSCVQDHPLQSQLIKGCLESVENNWQKSTYSTERIRGTSDNQSINPTKSSNKLNLYRENRLTVSVDESLALAPSRITILSDRGSWFNNHIPALIKSLWQRDHAVRWVHKPSELAQGDVCLLLSCGSLLSEEQLAIHSHNLVVHASALPKGQGWSPMTWQILEGESTIPLTLFEAAIELDAGPIYSQTLISLEGHELAEEWQTLQANNTIELCLNWFDHYKEIISTAQPQSGETSNYPRRRPKDSELNLELPLINQFNLLRVVDNERYPAYFRLHNRTFYIKIKTNIDERN
jgi:UDP-2,4-diacetamido-2,4,6-trideoxy-beta-L-altropyranose hydrolase